MTYRLFDIDYCIEPEDLELNEEDYALRSDYLRDCENEIDRILEDLPNEMFITIDEENFTPDELDDVFSDHISDETGWLIKSYRYEKVGVEN